MPRDEILLSLRDGRDRSVVLTRARLEHILAGHPELDDPALLSLLRQAIEDPVAIHHGSDLGEEWFYVRGGPSRWLKVVVIFDRDGSGRIITSFPRRRKP